MKIISTTIAFICLTGLNVFAQERIIGNNNDIWFLSHGDYTISNKWGIDSEIHFRTSDWGHDKQQILLRPSVYYKLNNLISIYGGYTFIETYPYGDQPINTRTPENNFWLQATAEQNISSWSVSHRYRFEERWISKVTETDGIRDVNGTTHRNRIRYRLTLKKALDKQKNWYIQVFDEVWVSYGENTQKNLFDQNWLYGGIGRKISHNLALELAYQWQIVNKSDGIHQESNNTIQLTMHYKFNFNKIKNG